MTCWTHLLLLIALALGSSALPVDAGQELSNPQKVADVETHKFFDRTNRLLTGAVIGAALADASTTMRNEHRHPELFREANPLARPFVEKGWPGMSALLVIDIAGELGVSYAFHRTKHHRLERCVPIVLAAIHVSAAIFNTRELHRAERSLR
jgi:hypothetical protein